MNIKHALLAASLLAFLACLLHAADLFVGSGAKAGEMTDRTAIIHVRLTATPGQNKKGLIPGREGQVRLHYSPSDEPKDAATTDWETARPDADWSIQFPLVGLAPATRYYY